MLNRAKSIHHGAFMTFHRLHERCACAAASQAFPGAERKYERSRPFRLQHLRLDLNLDFARRSVSGTASIDFERVSRGAQKLSLDAVGFDLRSVQMKSENGTRQIGYSYDGDQLQIEIPSKVETGQLRIKYVAHPRRGLYFLAPDASVESRPIQAWTQCQDEDARHWFPCHDKPHVKMTTELKVRVPPGMTVLSNGKLIAQKCEDGKQPWMYHFKLERPHPSYLVTLVVGELLTLEDRPAQLPDGSEVPVSYLVPPEREAEGWLSFEETPRMIELFSKLTGTPYPWGRYSQAVVSDFIFGGMENTTATTLYEHVLIDERAAIDISSHDLVAHELAHQWFGDYVTCRDWSHAWLNEGFATFFEHLEREDRLGRDEYEYGVFNDLQAYLSEAARRYQRPIVCKDYDAPIDLFDRHLYEKGGLVLHMLRTQLGASLFWQGIREYLERHAHGVVDSRDLQRALEDVSGSSLDQFFDHWVYRPGHPALRVHVSYEKDLLSIRVRQTQRGAEVPVFAFDLCVLVSSGQGGEPERHVKRIGSADDTLVVKLEQRPSWVGVDPDIAIAGSLRLDAPADMLQAQLRDGSTARVRWQAARALGRRHDVPTTDALGKALSRKREPWMVRVESARSLGRMGGATAFQWLERGSKSEHPKVRRAVARGLGSFRNEERAIECLQAMAREEPSFLVVAEVARSLGRLRASSTRPLLERLLLHDSWADVIRVGALDGLASLGDESVVRILDKWAAYGAPTRARCAAISGLAQTSDSRPVRERLEQLLADPELRVRQEAVSALSALGSSESRGALHHQLDRELDGRVRRSIKEALRSLGSPAWTQERKRLHDQIESLRGEVRDLRSRLSRLEESPKRRQRASKAAKSKEKKPS